MKEILSNQYDDVSGGWADKDGSSRSSADEGESRSGDGGNDKGASFLLDRTVSVYYSNPYGSGAGASGFWENGNSEKSGSGGYNGNGTGSLER